MTSKSKLSVKLNSTPGSFIDLWIEGTLSDIQEKIDNIIIVNFPAGSISTAKPLVNEISDAEIGEIFDLTKSFFRVYNNLTYQVKINLGKQLPNNDEIEVIMNVPDDFLSQLPENYRIELFALTYQDGGEEILDNFEILQSVYNEQSKTLTSKLPFWVFTDARNGNFETVLTIGSRPGINILTTKGIEMNFLNGCLGSSIACATSSCYVTSPYSLARTLDGKTSVHLGTDFRAPIGTPIYSVEKGKVIEIRTQIYPSTGTGWGLFIDIELDNNKGIVKYAHLSQTLVAVGETVYKGQLIAKSGMTGTLQPHLHFEYSPIGWIPEYISVARGRIDPYPCITTDELQSGTVTESRDGKTYKTVKIGTQWWMAENLAYLPSVSPPIAESITVPYYYVYGYNGTDVAVAKLTANYSTYGVLYNYPAALTSCPTNWHLPNDNDWNILTDYLIKNGYDKPVIGQLGKSVASKYNWDYSTSFGSPGNDPLSNNATGFSGLPGGIVIYGKFGFIFPDPNFSWLIGNSCWWWSSTVNTVENSSAMTLKYNSWDLGTGTSFKSTGMSVRCIKD